MNEKHLSSAPVLRKLQQMLQGEKVAAGGEKHKRFFEKMVFEDGVLQIQTQKSRTRFYCDHPEALREYLAARGIYDIEGKLSKENDKTRAETLLHSRDEKSSGVKTFKGFLVRVLEPLTVTIAGKKQELLPSNGLSTFIHDWKSFQIHSDAPVVIVENMENFTDLPKQQHLFPSSKSLFIYRFYDHHQSLMNWLKSVNNLIVYYGDWDFGGVKIFIGEFERKFTARCEFLIPDQLEELLAKSNQANQDRYYERLEMITPALYAHRPELVELVALFHRYKKVLAQEAMLIDGILIQLQ